ncbi:MAG TPA: SAM-dependent methyltransferase [Streptosporangiaceae bacterium]
MNDRLSPPDAFNPQQPNIARVYDYLLGGKDNFAADRAVGDQISTTLPAVQTGVRAQRDLLGRVVRYLVRDAGIRQLIDIGAGLPTAENVHEIAQRIDADTRTVYIDNDPVVLAHARAILAGVTTTIVVQGDLLQPAAFLADPEVREHLDWEQPIAVLLCGIMHYVLDEEDPGAAMDQIIEALPDGSYVFIHHLVSSDDPVTADLQEAMQQGLGRTRFRTHEEVLSLFRGLELVDPGLVPVPDWRPDPDTPGASEHPVLKLASAGLARKTVRRGWLARLRRWFSSRRSADPASSAQDAPGGASA